VIITTIACALYAVIHEHNSPNNFRYEMMSARLARGQLVALVATGVVLFLLGFLIGYFTIPNDDADTTPRTIEELRRDEIHEKEQYHSKLYKSLNKAEIGKNLRYVYISCIIA
jgi:di/tricarboxylate transporter